MNLETRIREAVDEALLTPLDLDGGLLHLQRTRHHRAAARAGAVAVLVALVAIGFSLDRHQAAAPQPTPAPHDLTGGAMVSLTQEGQVVQVAGPHLPYLPVSAAPLGPFEFTHDGSALLYAADGDLRELDLATGVAKVLAPCTQSICIDRLDPDGRTRAHGPWPRHCLRERRLTLGPGVLGRRRDGTPRALVVARRQAGRVLRRPRPLPDVRRARWTARAVTWSGSRKFLHSDVVMGDLMWSLDGHQIAFLLRTASGEARLMTVTPTSDPLLETVRVLGDCTCYHALPSLAWSPDGTRIAVSLPTDTASGGPIWSVRRDGSGWRRESAGGFDNRLAWQPRAVTQP